MEEKIYEVEMVSIQNTTGTNYVLEASGRRTKTVKLNFTKVEGVEIKATRALELKHSYLQMAEGQNKMWNIRFGLPTTLIIQYALGRIQIESV